MIQLYSLVNHTILEEARDAIVNYTPTFQFSTSWTTSWQNATLLRDEIRTREGIPTPHETFRIEHEGNLFTLDFGVVT